jgi:mRNA-degrading endonuclease YafQ of YafQ-DinJ toxin-antitoxin module
MSNWTSALLYIERRPSAVNHIEPDWLLLYKIEGDDLILARTGSHTDLFR